MRVPFSPKSGLANSWAALQLRILDANFKAVQSKLCLYTCPYVVQQNSDVDKLNLGSAGRRGIPAPPYFAVCLCWLLYSTQCLTCLPVACYKRNHTSGLYNAHTKP